MIIVSCDDISFPKLTIELFFGLNLDAGFENKRSTNRRLGTFPNCFGSFRKRSIIVCHPYYLVFFPGDQDNFGAFTSISPKF